MEYQGYTKDGFRIYITGKRVVKRECPRCGKDMSNRAKSARYCVKCAKG